MNALIFFLALIIGLPLFEIYFLIEVGSIIGALPTIAITIFTAVAGVTLIRIQGLKTVQKMQLSLAQGQTPAVEILEGVMLFIAAIMLLIPGFFSDSIGFLLLLPPLRVAIAKWWIKHQQANFQQYQRQSSEFIEAEYEDVTVQEAEPKSIKDEKDKKI